MKDRSIRNISKLDSYEGGRSRQLEKVTHKHNITSRRKGAFMNKPFLLIPNHI